MANFNVQIDLTKLPGAKVMEIEGKTKKRMCVVIPIDNSVGTVCDGYPAKGRDGLMTMKYFDDVKLSLVAIERRSNQYGISHGLKAAYSQQYMERITEEQLFKTPWLGTVKPWGAPGSKSEDVEDLPEDNDNDW